MFKEVKSHTDFASMEEALQKKWQTDKIFEKSFESKKGNDEFVFFDGPPFATGLPHYGHLLAGTIKDVIPRYQTMLGKYVERVFGWDCHGLPVEYEMEKELELSGKKEIEDYGIDKFNEACRSIVLRYTAEWENIVKRMGRWVDFKNGYRTMDKDYMESIWWVFKQLWDKNLIYEGYKILPYCPRCATPLSNFEANQGYEEVQDPAITIKFKARNMDNTYLLAWTTTPWTLPSNMALAAGPDIDYVKVKDDDVFYILAAARVPVYYGNRKPEIVEHLKSSDLKDIKYEPLFDYFANFAEKGAFRVIEADFVSTEDGTGIVHIAPGFGEDDADAGKENNIPEVCPIDAECRFTAEISDYQGHSVKETDKEIIRQLKNEGKLIHRSNIKHSYPHCWRDDTPLIYRAVSTWFVKIDKIKEQMLDANSQINWVPSHIKDGRFGKWLENARDWAISRNRYWGCPLPLWKNNETGETKCVGSVAELEELTGKKIDDIHKHFVDKLEIKSENGKSTLQRVPEVLDCWFESGAMPYAQQHYPFENKKHFEMNFPADFIAEGLDQTRGWFYTLVVLGAALFDKPAFSNVVVNGLILAEDGQKMSKRKKNYPDPKYIIDHYGADALRLFLLGSPVVRGEDLKFSEDGIKDLMRSVIIPIWNAYSFFVTYANVDHWQPDENSVKGPDNPSNPLDRWILASMTQMIEEIRESMDAYRIQKAANRFEKFVEDLTNWYIRRSRRRFWKSDNDTDKNEAYQTLYHVLVTFAKTAAPFIPFVTEEIFSNLKSQNMSESVHLCDYPKSEKSLRDEYLERQMDYTMNLVQQGRYLRSKHSMKVRQPLSKAVIVVHNEKIREMLKNSTDIISEELNVKNIEFVKDDKSLVHREAAPNFPKLGKQLGSDMKDAKQLIGSLSENDIDKLLNGENIKLNFPSGREFEISENDIEIKREEKSGMSVSTDDEITIALETELNDSLLNEGFAREFVSRIQNLRKDMDFNVSDRIKIEYSVPDKCSEAIKEFSKYICDETLARSLTEGISTEKYEKLEINNFKCRISVKKKN